MQHVTEPQIVLSAKEEITWCGDRADDRYGQERPPEIIVTSRRKPQLLKLSAFHFGLLLYRLFDVVLFS